MKISLQKGKITPNVKTNKTKTTSEKLSEDRSNAALRRSGQEMTLLTPR